MKGGAEDLLFEPQDLGVLRLCALQPSLQLLLQLRDLTSQHRRLQRQGSHNSRRPRLLVLAQSLRHRQRQRDSGMQACWENAWVEGILPEQQSDE